MDKLSRFDIHNHTRYSNIRLRDALPTPKQLIDRAIDIGLCGVAITDHESLSGHVKANQYAIEIAESHPDFKVALGDEIYLVDSRPADKHYHFILVAKDAIGHKQLRELSTLAWLNSYSAKGLERVDTLKSDLKRIVEADKGHLIASTACLGGEVGSNILALTEAEQVWDGKGAETAHNNITNLILFCKELFGEDFYLEVQPGISPEQIIMNKRMLKIAEAFQVKLICSSDSHYLKSEDRYVHKAYLNSEDKEREVDAFYQDAYLHTNEEMFEKFVQSEYTAEQVNTMFNNTMEIWNKIENYSLFHPQKIPMVEVKEYLKDNIDLSEYKVLQSLVSSDDAIDRYWVNECVNKLKQLDKYNDKYLSRLEEEATTKQIIGEKLGTNIFAYPITLQYYINKFWELGSTVGAGRGSSCSGLNHYLLGVTQIDPLEYSLPFWRYLNPDRAELPDIDVDISPSKRPAILNYIKKERGQKFTTNNEMLKNNLGCTLVATFGTETAKAAVATACRGYRSEEYTEGIDIDTSAYLSSLIPVERGFVWSISDTYYGNEEAGRKPVAAFVNEVNQYAGLLDIMLGIEGNISRRGSHASGVIFNDEDPFEFNAYMRTPSGDITTQYDLHDAEWCGATKYDLLVTEIQDKIIETIKLLQEDNEIEPYLSLREVYDKYLHPAVLPVEDDEKIWEAIQNVKVLDLFQFDSQVGNQAAKKIKPSTVLELADANGLMRLMAMETGETPLDKYVRFKNDLNLWYDEMKFDYGLSPDEIIAVERHFKRSYGVPPSQEQLMTMLMDKDICNFTLKEANDARKIVGKKLLSKVPALHEKVLAQAKSPNLGKYIWECGIGPQMSYSFSIIHALAYSFIACQTAFLATHFNPIYWDTACLIVNSGSLEETESEVVSIYEKEDDDDYTYEDLPGRSGKKKSKNADYGKIAKAIGTIQSRGINLSLVNINKSDYGFKPDAKNNRILYGLKPISNINAEIIEKIKSGRPYVSFKDFLFRCPLTKTAMINLIKGGAFDEIDSVLNTREKIMVYYLSTVAGFKSTLNLRNFNGLMNANLLPADLKLQMDMFRFNKYLKDFKLGATDYQLNDSALNFIETCLPDYVDCINIKAGVSTIDQKAWDKIYKATMETAKVWIKNNLDEVLMKFNSLLLKEIWDKYATGTRAKWEMDALCFYHDRHELADVDILKYGISNFNDLSPEPEVEYMFKKGGREIPIYQIRKIIGTVIAKDDTHSSVVLLTTSGTVSVKFSREYYSMFKKQISEVQADGKKKVIEKSWFGRGNKLMVCGYRRQDEFVSKTYKKTNAHQLYHIDAVEGTDILVRHDRLTGKDTEYEED